MTTTRNSESRKVRELTERELKDVQLKLVSGGTGAVNPGKSGFTDIGGLSVEVG